MKKFFTLAALFASVCFSSSAVNPGTDDLSVSVLTGSYSNGDHINEVVYGPVTGAEYEFCDLNYWWGQYGFNESYGSMMIIPNNYDDVRLSEMMLDLPYDQVKVYGGAGRMTYSDVAEFGYAEQLGIFGGETATFTVPEGYAYIFIIADGESATVSDYRNMSFTWAANGGGGEVSGDAYLPTVAGSSVVPDGMYGSYIVSLQWPSLTEGDDSVMAGATVTDAAGNVIEGSGIEYGWADYSDFSLCGIQLFSTDYVAGVEYTAHVPAGAFRQIDENGNAVVPAVECPEFTVTFTLDGVIAINGGQGGDTPGGNIDTINYANILAQNPGAETTDDSSATSPLFNGTLTGATGAEYQVLGTVLISDGELMYQIYNSDGYCFSNTTAPEGMWLKSVTTHNHWGDQMTVFYSAEPFTFTGRYSEGVGSIQLTGWSNPVMDKDVNVIEINEPCKYFMVVGSYEKFKDVVIEWTDVKPVPTVATPEISCWESRYVPGTQAYVKTSTVGATLTGKVFINGEAAPDYDFETVQNSEWSSYTFVMPGKAFDEIRLEVTGSKEEWLDSETAVAEWTLSEPPCPAPYANGQQNPRYFIAGKPVVLNVYDAEMNVIEGAEITYRYQYYGNNAAGEYVYEDYNEYTTAPAPVEITIPAAVDPGMQFVINSRAVAPGYSEGESRTIYVDVMSEVAQAPALSVENGAQLDAGQEFSISKNYLYPELHYIVNGGEEIVTDNNYVYFTVNDENNEYEIVTWCGGGGFTDSEKVTYHVSLYVMPENVDAFLPFEGVSDTKAVVYNYTGNENNGSLEYVYYGGVWNNQFYMNWNASPIQFFGNLTAGQYHLTGIRVDMGGVDTGMVNVFLADEALVTETSMLNGIDSNSNFGDNGLVQFYIANRFDSGWNVPLGGGIDQWVDLAELNARLIDEGWYDEDETELFVTGRKYFAMRAFNTSQGVRINRIMVQYDSPETSVEAIEADNEATAVYYNLSGVRVENANMTPGLYIRINGTKASKVLVK